MPNKHTVRILRVREGATLKEIYADYKKQFSAADLQQYTEIVPMVPAQRVLAEVQAICADNEPKPRKRRKP
jgi:hypothetical protein